MLSQYRIYQGSGIRLPGVLYHFIRRPLLYDLSLIHDQDSLTHMLDQSQIMADKQKRKLSFLLKSFQQFHDLSLNGYVQSAGGFIADHQPGIYSQRPGYGCPLAFSPPLTS